MSKLDIMLQRIEEKDKERKASASAAASAAASTQETSREENVNEKKTKLSNKSINDLIEKSRGYKKFNPEDPLNENPDPCCKCKSIGCEKKVERTILIISLTFLAAFFIALFFYT